MLVYLIAGYATSGKDTVGSIFERVGFRRYAFADPLKFYSAQLHGYDIKLTQTQSGKETVVHSKKTNRTATVRQFLIDDSLQMKKEQGDNIWGRAVVEEIRTHTPKYAVITDWRYKHEAAYLRAQLPHAKIITLRVLRDSVKPSTDASEHDLDSVQTDFTIHNNTTIDSLTNHCYDILANEL